MNKKYFMELIGTFFLTLAVCVSGGNPLAVGTMLMAIVYAGWHVSGAHYNPAITLAMMMRGKIKSQVAGLYMISQVAGAFFAAVLFHRVIGKVFTIRAVSSEVLLSVGMETILTLLLTLVVITMVVKLKNSDLYGLSIGLTIAAIVSLGGIVNPAIAAGSFISGVFQGGMQVPINGVMIHIVGPLLGGGMAVYLYDQLN